MAVSLNDLNDLHQEGVAPGLRKPSRIYEVIIHECEKIRSGRRQDVACSCLSSPLCNCVPERRDGNGSPLAHSQCHDLRQCDRAVPGTPYLTLDGATRSRRCGCAEAFGEDRQHLLFCQQYPTGIESPGTT